MAFDAHGDSAVDLEVILMKGYYLLYMFFCFVFFVSKSCRGSNPRKGMRYVRLIS